MRFRDWLTFTPLFFKCLDKLPIRHLMYLARQMRNENPQRHNGRVHINTFFPSYPSAAFDKFLHAVIDRKRVPYSTYFAVTDQCPYRCSHCSYGNHQPGSVDTDQVLEIIRQINLLGTVTIGFTGGEPLLREDIVTLVDAVGEATQSIIFTTGHNLTNELAKQLQSADLGCLMIGLESDRENEHDQVRGVEDSFAEALRAIEMSLQSGNYTAISTVATRNKINQGKLLALAELALKLGVHEFRILEPIPTGRYQDKKEQILTEAESQAAAEFHKQWNRKKRGPSICSFSYLESDEMFGCGAGYHHLFIDAVGNVCPCDLTPLSFGNVLKQPLIEIWQQMETYFSLPRCSCLMKGICQHTLQLSQDGPWPLAPENSRQICEKITRPDRLPAIYQNYLKDLTGEDQETHPG